MRERPLVSELANAIIKEDYASAIEIITDDNFDPNAKTKSNNPLLYTIINVLIDLKSIQDKTSLMNILNEIVKHKDFNPNEVNGENETVLMNIARHPDFNFLSPLLLYKTNIDVNIKNKYGNDAARLADAYDNKVLLDLITSFKIQHMKFYGLPRKREGIKTKERKATVSNKIQLMNRIERAFDDKARSNPISLYWLTYYFVRQNYIECMRIVNDVHFNPNETDKWETPVLTSLIYISQDNFVECDEEEFKKIAKGIVNNRLFDYNSMDDYNNTPIMASMKFKNLNWLTHMLFSSACTRIDITNKSGKNLHDISKDAGNEDFYKEMINCYFSKAESI